MGHASSSGSFSAREFSTTVLGKTDGNFVTLRWQWEVNECVCNDMLLFELCELRHPYLLCMSPRHPRILSSFAVLLSELPEVNVRRRFAT